MLRLGDWGIYWISDQPTNRAYLELGRVVFLFPEILPPEIMCVLQLVQFPKGTPTNLVLRELWELRRSVTQFPKAARTI